VAEQPIAISAEKLARVRGAIPANDFIDAQYDADRDVVTTDVLVILSTPRSGSTLLCELLRLNDVCLPHEYFQPGQYLPLLADRGGCVDGEELNAAKYVAALRRYRTFANGWLGINLHGSHLELFDRLGDHLKGTRIHYLHLVRRDVLAQAVSYHIASQTGQWSSEFSARHSPEYDFSKIENRLQRIQGQNLLIASYLAARELPAPTIYYEDLARDPAGMLRQVPGVPPGRALCTQPTLQRQAGTRSSEWRQRFAREYYEATVAAAPPSAGSRLGQLQRLLRGR
jgi:LPS sulfotransferase NodH